MSNQYEDKELLDELMQIIPQITDVQYLRVKQLITQKQIAEQQRLIDAIDENASDRYPKIIEGDSLTYVSHGYAVACKQMKHNAKNRIAQLTKQKGK